MKNQDAKARSIAQKLSNLSKKLNRPYRYVSTSFFIERMVVRALATPFNNKLVFKGGYVGLRVYDSQRYTVDLDAVLNLTKQKNHLKQLQKAIESDIGDGVWFKLEHEKNLPLQTILGGIKQIYRAGLGIVPRDISKATVVHFDIGFDDSIVPNPVNVTTPSILGNDEISWKVYPVETIIAEKIHAFVFREGGSSRAKDLYDLSFYLPQVDKENLRLAIKSCFEHRKTKLPEGLYETMKSYDLTLAKKSWLKFNTS